MKNDIRYSYCYGYKPRSGDMWFLRFEMRWQADAQLKQPGTWFRFNMRNRIFRALMRKIKPSDWIHDEVRVPYDPKWMTAINP